eukprot:CAMPEP_0179313286 /NCGR_PEP_ID=MMETSP0797-20121207/53740_1 /TAXON_ID=47934 /ORGANISM="Dinophysis acuminata, Strain DAEP01" /LENGTH=75 /DNA_ID=CAMNT_0021023319 /DNA_START=51 /DNA_END=278 /DNA_ORIENTATION=-
MRQGVRSWDGKNPRTRELADADACTRGRGLAGDGTEDDDGEHVVFFVREFPAREFFPRVPAASLHARHEGARSYV